MFLAIDRIVRLLLCISVLMLPMGCNTLGDNEASPDDSGGENEGKQGVEIVPLETPADGDYELPVDLPSCDAQDALIVDENADWKQINSEDYRIFCIAPGDYRDAGAITLTASGGPDEPRWIRWYDPANPSDTTTHPWHMAEEKRVFVEKMDLTGANYWIIDRIRFNRSMNVIDDSNRNIFNRVMFYQMQLKDSGGGRICINIRNGSDYNTVQNSVLGDTEPVHEPGSAQDDVGVFCRDADYNRIVKNEIFDMPSGDGVQTGQSKQHAVRTIVQNNDFYISTGFEHSVENAIDFKAGSALNGRPPRSDWMLIENNRIWNWGGGSAIVLHYEGVSGVEIRYNTIWGNEGRAYTVSQRDSIYYHSVHHNVIYDTGSEENEHGGGLKPRQVDFSTYDHNIFVDVYDWLDYITADAEENEIRRNVFINTGRNGSSNGAAFAMQNVYYNSTPFETTPESMIYEDAADAKHEDLCFQFKRITDPTEVCIPNGKVTSASPHAEWFDINN